MILERTLTREQFVSVVNARRRRALRREEISCDKYRREMTGCAASEQIDLERNGERGKEKMKERGREAGGVWHYSITIRAVLDFPTFQNKETNFSQSPLLDPRGRITLFFSRQPRSLNPFPVPFSKSPPYNSEHCGIFITLSYAFLKS